MEPENIIKSARKIYTTCKSVEQIVSEDGVDKETLEKIEEGIYLFLECDLTIHQTGQIAQKLNINPAVIGSVIKDFFKLAVKAYEYYQKKLDQKEIISVAGAARHVGLRRDLYEDFFWYKQHLADTNTKEGKGCLARLQKELVSTH